ncbi:MAG: ribosome small subunit-dependent GTPase A [Tuberibacillus sp.]
MPTGKIVKALSGFYYVNDQNVIYQCRARGNFRKKKITPLVGDIVEYESTSLTDGYVLSVEERKNALVRPPVANIDQAILVFSAKEPDFDHTLLDRFLVHIESNDMDPLICISKMDLINQEPNRLQEIMRYADQYREIGYPVILISSVLSEGIENLYPYLKGKTSVVAGQSGVGKSTLLNALDPSLSIETGEISKALGRGKHTTRHVELIPIQDGYVADTPGFSSLEFIDIEAGELSRYFREIEAHSGDCKFRGCTHISEPGCAVKEAVEDRVIAQERYRNYVQFFEEISNRKKRY